MNKLVKFVSKKEFLVGMLVATIAFSHFIFSRHSITDDLKKGVVKIASGLDISEQDREERQKEDMELITKHHRLMK